MWIALASEIMPSMYIGDSTSLPSFISFAMTSIISCALPTAGTGISTLPPSVSVLFIDSEKLR